MSSAGPPTRAGPHLVSLSPSECWLHLAATHLGRVGVSVQALPHIFPVNYVLDDGDIVFVSGRGTKLAAASKRTVVVFEIDGFDPFDHSGWSVEVTGTSALVTDPQELEHAQRLPLSPWAAPEDGCFIRIQPAEISGRRITQLSATAVGCRPAGG